jgi:hypothetical protein
MHRAVVPVVTGRIAFAIGCRVHACSDAGLRVHAAHLAQFCTVLWLVSSDCTDRSARALLLVYFGCLAVLAVYMQQEEVTCVSVAVPAAAPAVDVCSMVAVRLSCFAQFQVYICMGAVACCQSLSCQCVDLLSHAVHQAVCCAWLPQSSGP